MTLLERLAVRLLRAILLGLGVVVCESEEPVGPPVGRAMHDAEAGEPVSVQLGRPENTGRLVNSNGDAPPESGTGLHFVGWPDDESHTVEHQAEGEQW